MTFTKVSKTSLAIRKILDAVASKYRGTNIVVREVPSTWEMRFYGSHEKAEYLNLPQLFATGAVRGRLVERAILTQSLGITLPAPPRHEALVVQKDSKGVKGVEIIIREDVIDSSAVAVATDALLARNKKAAQQAAGTCGETAGLCMALAEAHARALTKGESAEDLTAMLTSTAQSTTARRAKKSAAQLEREIASALTRRR